MIEDEADDEFYDSGPFCRHWSDPTDCERECGACGHACKQHPSDTCNVENCHCSGWQDEEVEPLVEVARQVLRDEHGED